MGCASGSVCLEGVCRRYAKTGEPCDVTHSCDSSIDTCTAGVCRNTPYAKRDEACGHLPTGYIACAGHLTCSDRGGAKESGFCVAPTGDGQACNTDIGPGCVSPAKCFEGVCTVPDVAECAAKR